MITTNIRQKNRIKDVIQRRESSIFKFCASNKWYKEIGISKKRFAKLLTNEQQPNLTELEVIAKELEVSISELINL